MQRFSRCKRPQVFFIVNKPASGYVKGFPIRCDQHHHFRGNTRRGLGVLHDGSGGYHGDGCCNSTSPQAFPTEPTRVW